MWRGDESSVDRKWTDTWTRVRYSGGLYSEVLRESVDQNEELRKGWEKTSGG